jgi:hypothetical protein
MSNDDQSPLVTLISCMVCGKTMKLETIAPDGEGDDLIKYRCGQCGRIERSLGSPKLALMPAAAPSRRRVFLRPVNACAASLCGRLSNGATAGQ